MVIPGSLSRPIFATLFTVAVVSGCATAGDGSGATRRSSDVISQAELEEAIGDDLFLVIQRLRPRWTRPRTERTFTQTMDVSLIVDGVRWDTNLSRLREISVADVREIRYLNAVNATTQYGPDMAGGAILVFRKGTR